MCEWLYHTREAKAMLKQWIGRWLRVIANEFTELEALMVVNALAWSGFVWFFRWVLP